MRFIILTCFSAAWMAVMTVIAGDISKHVALSDTPEAVQKAIRAQAGDGVLGEIDRVMDGETAYDVELTAKDGRERDFTVDETGKLIRLEVSLAEAPAPVRKTVQTLIGGGKLESIDRIVDDAEISYDVAVAKTTNDDRYFTIAEDGTLLSAEVALNETPDAVRQAIRARVGDGKIESIGKDYDDDGIRYDVEMSTKEGREKGFTITADGVLESEQVALEETPPAVRRTVRNRIGDGKVLRVDKSYVKEKGVLPYEIEGRKDGKPFDFIVGPRGRFLGMDE